MCRTFRMIMHLRVYVYHVSCTYMYMTWCNRSPWPTQRVKLPSHWRGEKLEDGDLEFSNVVWTDKCTVQLKFHHHWTFRQVGASGELPENEAETPSEDQCLGGNIIEGSYPSCSLFRESMRQDTLISLKLAWSLFLTKCIPNGHHFQQDNVQVIMLSDSMKIRFKLVEDAGLQSRFQSNWEHLGGNEVVSAWLS